MSINRFHARTVAVVLSLILAGCGAIPGGTIRPTEQVRPTPPATTADLLGLLSNSATDVQVGIDPAPAWQGTTGQTVLIGDEPIWVYQAADADDAAVDQLRAGAPDRKIWRTDALVVTYDGFNGGVILVLSSLLGDPDLVLPPVQDEPYPPAVVAGLDAVAAELGVAPQTITVNAFEPIVWPDGCLGFPSESLDCEIGPFEGWLIRAAIGEQQLEIHTDSLAERMRYELEQTGVDAGGAQ